MSNLFSIVFILSLKGSAIFLLVLLLYKIAKGKIKSSIKNAIWIVVLFTLTIPMQIKVPIIEQSNIAPEKESEIMYFINSNIYDTSTVNNILNTETTLESDSIEKTPSNAFLYEDFLELLAMIWIIGVGLFSLFYILELMKLKMKYKNEKLIENVEIKKIVNNLKYKHNIKREIRIYETDKLSLPSVIGIINPSIYIPKYLLEDISLKSLNHIIGHEICHIKRLDNYKNFMLLVYKIVYWYNPFIYAIVSSIKQDMEIACDQHAIRDFKKSERIEYGMSIINISSKVYSRKNEKNILIASLIDNKENMKERITMIKGSKKSSLIVTTMIVSVLVLSSCTLATLGDGKDDIKETTITTETLIESPEAEVTTPELIPISIVTNIEDEADTNPLGGVEGENVYYYKALEAAELNFGFKQDNSIIENESITDMGKFMIVVLENNKGPMSIRVEKETLDAYMITAIMETEYDLKVEYAKSKSISDLNAIDSKDYYKFYLAQATCSEEDGLKIAKEFIENSPREINDFELKNTTFDKVFDQDLVEWYVYEFSNKNDSSNGIYVYVNVYLQKVTSYTEY